MNKINKSSNSPVFQVELSLTKRDEQGATLIVVLLVVLLLAVIGTIAIRHSQTSLDMTTAAQVNQLLMQSSDVPIAKLELSGEELGSNNMSQLQNMASDDTGPISLLSTSGLKDFEYVLCYQPVATKNLYKLGNHRIILNSDGSKTRGLRNGYCQIKNSSSSNNFFTSARQTVASQVSLTRPTVNDNLLDDVEVQPLSALNEGMDSGSVKKSDAIYFRSYVTSIAPSLAKASTIAEIDNCLKLPIGGLAGTNKDENQNYCLGATDTPVNIQVQDFVYNIDAESE